MRLINHSRSRPMRRSLLPVLLSTALAGAVAPVAAQSDDAAASPSAPPIASEPRDLYLDMPYTLGGFDPEIVMVRGDEHFATLDPDSATDAQRRAEVGVFLGDVGASIEDMTSGYALANTDSIFAFVVGIRVNGAEPGRMLPAYLPILLADLQDPTTSQARMGGKDVTVVASVGEADEVVDLYVYDAGDTLWMVQGPLDVVDITLDDLP